MFKSKKRGVTLERRTGVTLLRRKGVSFKRSKGVYLDGISTGGGYFAIKLLLDGNEMQGEDLIIRKNFLLENSDEIKTISIPEKLTP